MKYPWAIPGRKVICLSDNFPNYAQGEVTPVKGLTYTIREVLAFNAGVGLWLEEIHNKPGNYRHPDTRLLLHAEPAFIITSFRPVFNTDISVFTRMLKTKEHAL